MEPDDKYTIDISDCNTITIEIPSDPAVGDIFYDVNQDDIKIYGTDSDWITIDSGNINWNNISLDPVLWEDRMPDLEQVKKMCEQYPALDKAYENFKTIYSMVEQDWKGNYNDEDELSF